MRSKKITKSISSLLAAFMLCNAGYWGFGAVSPSVSHAEETPPKKSTDNSKSVKNQQMAAAIMGVLGVGIPLSGSVKYTYITNDPRGNFAVVPVCTGTTSPTVDETASYRCIISDGKNYGIAQGSAKVTGGSQTIAAPGTYKYSYMKGKEKIEGTANIIVSFMINGYEGKTTVGDSTTPYGSFDSTGYNDESSFISGEDVTDYSDVNGGNSLCPDGTYYCTSDTSPTLANDSNSSDYGDYYNGSGSSGDSGSSWGNSGSNDYGDYNGSGSSGSSGGSGGFNDYGDYNSSDGSNGSNGSNNSSSPNDYGDYTGSNSSDGSSGSGNSTGSNSSNDYTDSSSSDGSSGSGNSTGSNSSNDYTDSNSSDDSSGSGNSTDSTGNGNAGSSGSSGSSIDYGDLIDDLLNDNNSYNSGNNDWASSNGDSDGTSNLDDYFNGLGDEAAESLPDYLTDDLLGVDSDLLGMEAVDTDGDGVVDSVQMENGETISPDDYIAAKSSEGNTGYDASGTNADEDLYNGGMSLQDFLNSVDGLNSEETGDDSLNGLSDNNSLAARIKSLINEKTDTSSGNGDQGMTEQQLFDMAKKLLLANGMTLEDIVKGKNYDKNSAYTEPANAWDMNRITTLLKAKKIKLEGADAIRPEQSKKSLTSTANKSKTVTDSKNTKTK